MRSLILICLLAVVAGAQVYTYTTRFGYLAFPAWADTVEEKPSFYFGLQYEKKMVIKWIEYDPAIKQYAYYVDWVAVK